MSLNKHRYPILEYDSDSHAIILADPDKSGPLPQKCVVTFSDYADQYARQVKAQAHSEFATCTRLFTIYKTHYEGEAVCFCNVPLGASASVQLVDHLFMCGVRHMIASGSCGALIDMDENEIVIPLKALRDEGTSYHYIKPDRFVNLNPSAINAIEQALNNLSIAYRRSVTWTTDGFFRETKRMVNYRIKEGCQVVEMECAALAACAEFRKSIFGHILFTGDSLANAEKHDQRNWGQASIEKAFYASLDAVMLIDG